MVYIREFNPNGCKMVLRNTLQGHDLDITAVRWNDVYNKWITASEDGTIKIWVSSTLQHKIDFHSQTPISQRCG